MFEQQLGRSLTIDQAAELLHVSRRTVYNRIRDGKLETIRTIGGSQRVLLRSVEENQKSIGGERAGAQHAAHAIRTLGYGGLMNSRAKGVWGQRLVRANLPSVTRSPKKRVP